MAVLSRALRLRGFIACRPSSDAVAALEERLQPLRRTYRQTALRWVPPQNWHVTLRFLGAIAPDRAVLLEPALSAVAARTRCIGSHLAGVLPLPQSGTARVIALGISPDDELVQLAEAVDDAIGGRRDHSFAAHVTLMRMKRPGRVLGERVIGAITRLMVEPIPCGFEQLGLYRSDMTAAGPRYSALIECPFGA